MFYFLIYKSVKYWNSLKIIKTDIFRIIKVFKYGELKLWKGEKSWKSKQKHVAISETY
jgi:hypothetical protein